MVLVPDTTDATLHDPHGGLRPAGTDSADAEVRLLAAAGRAVVDSASTLAFWSAIALPALYLPFLATGLSGPDDLAVFLGLFAVHVLSLFAGRSHLRDRRS